MTTTARPLEAQHDRFTIPLGEPGPFRFYVRSLLVPHSRREMVWAALAQVSPAAASAASAMLGSSAKQGLRGRPANAGDSYDVVQRTCTALCESRAIRGKRPSAIVLSDYGHSDRGKMVLFIFEEGAREPSVVAKVSGTPKHRSTLKRQQETLRRVRERLAGSLSETLPLPLGEFGEGASTAFAETYTGGTSMYVQMRRSWHPREQAEKHFRDALGWLIQFQTSTRSQEVRLHKGMVREHVEEPLRRYAGTCALPDNVRNVFVEAARLARELKDERLPLTGSHGDFWARNIMIGSDGLSVIDWDSYKDQSPAFHDLFHFAVSYGLSYPWQPGRWADPATAFRSAFLSNSWLSELTRRHFHNYSRVMGLSPAMLKIFFPVYLAEQALAELRTAPSRQASECETSRGRWGRLLEEYAQHGRSFCF